MAVQSPLERTESNRPNNVILYLIDSYGLNMVFEKEYEADGRCKTKQIG